MNKTDGVKAIEISEFDYPLPENRIASHPLAGRDSCLLLVRNPCGELTTERFSALPKLLPPDSMLVYNNTKVINARLRFRKPSAGGHEGALIEVFCLEPHYPTDYAVNFASEHKCAWMCFVGNSKRWKDGPVSMTVNINGRAIRLEAVRLNKIGNASIVEFTWDSPGITFSDIISNAGEIPIPPYLNRPTEKSDSNDYQTVYSKVNGSVAAPTAGLHFTPEVLEAIDLAGIPRRELTLHVGAGTFQPVKSEEIGGHPMHSEFFSVSRSLIEELKESGRRIIAVGTTSVRTLESLYHLGCMMLDGDTGMEVPQWRPYEDVAKHSVEASLDALLAYLDINRLDSIVASTRIIIAPGYEFKIVKGMITNFHQPKSTLLLLVSAFTSGDWRRMYDYALSGEFRFLSYGDASLLLK